MLPCIIIDTREKRPYSFSDRVTTMHATLPGGDYSLQGYETQIAIERKSLDDFVQTLIHAQERFSRELGLLRTYPRAWIVVEATLDDVLQGRYTSRAHPQSVLALTAALMARYGIPVLFASDRPSAVALVEMLLLQWHAQQQDGR